MVGRLAAESYRNGDLGTLELYLGDNPDAVYFGAYVQPGRSYRIRGNLAGATFTSFSQELGTADGGYSRQTVNVVKDSDLHPDPDGKDGGPELGKPIRRTFGEHGNAPKAIAAAPAERARRKLRRFIAGSFIRRGSGSP